MWGWLGLACLASPTARADDPADRPQVCVAQWARPTDRCAWREPLVVRASGRNEETARKNAVARLRLVFTDLVRAASLDAEGTMAAVQVVELEPCPRVPESDLQIACIASPNLAVEGLCQAELPASDCWSVSAGTWQGLGWQAAEEARHGLCQQALDQAAERVATEAELLRCRASCQAQVLVRCGPH
jgi:hypothetical protein